MQVFLTMLSLVIVLIQVWYSSGRQKELESHKARLQRELEDDKAGLQGELEAKKAKLQTDLQISVHEFETRFSLLHQKRLEIVGELYARSAEAVNLMRAITSPLVMEDEDEHAKHQTELIRRFLTARDGLDDFFTLNRVFLSEDTCGKLDALVKRFLHIQIDYGTFERWKGSAGAGEYWRQVQEGSERLVGILGEIETELRGYLSTVESASARGPRSSA